MAYPPTVPPVTRNNATPQHDNHPDDHNGISAALSDIINELGADPSSGSYPTVQARLEAIKASVDSQAVSIASILTMKPIAMSPNMFSNGNVIGETYVSSTFLPVDWYNYRNWVIIWTVSCSGHSNSGTIQLRLANAANTYITPAFSTALEPGLWNQVVLNWGVAANVGENVEVKHFMNVVGSGANTNTESVVTAWGLSG